MWEVVEKDMLQLLQQEGFALSLTKKGIIIQKAAIIGFWHRPHGKFDPLTAVTEYSNMAY